MGHYQLDTNDAKTIVSVLKDVILALNLDFHKLRSQCYDGASTMSGGKAGVAKMNIDEEPCAYYTLP